MTIKYQLSDKRGDAILLASAEGDDPAVVEQDFAEAVALAGLANSYEAFARPPAAPPQYAAPASIGQAVVNAQPLAQPQVPAAAAPTCQHGQKQYKSGDKNGRKWEAWACPARSSDPTRCGFEWIR
jgi:hypothetical protein